MKKLSLLFAIALQACGPTTRTGAPPRGDTTPSRDALFSTLDITVSASLAKDPEVERFLEERGNPSHVDIEKASFSPPVVKLYYLQDRKVWDLSKADKGWKLTGPLPITPSVLKELGAPSAPSQEDLEEFGTSPSAEEPKEAKNETIEQVVARFGKEDAESTPKGDLVHIVASAGERYEDVAAWYTYDRENAMKIARMNGGNKDEKLQISDQVVVPKYLLKHNKRLPSEAIEALRGANQ